MVDIEDDATRGKYVGNTTECNVALQPQEEESIDLSLRIRDYTSLFHILVD